MLTSPIANILKMYWKTRLETFICGPRQTPLKKGMRICNRMKTTADADYRARRKSLQAQCRIVQKSLRFRIGRLQHLKAVVQNKTINDIGLNPAAHSVGCLYQQVIGPLCLQPAGTAEACKARPDNDHVESFWIHFAFPINFHPEYLLRLIMFDVE
jgi:hypothetical protein